MAYSELIKSFERIRSYMREFYIYGFKTRTEYNRKSARSYDNEKRRIESYLGDYMGFSRTQDGKNMFLSIDSRSTSVNPFYKAFKAKSFTDGDITLHFILLDILYSPEVKLPLSDITKQIDTEYLSGFEKPVVFDESTVRKKLKEYAELGLITMEKSGRQTLYSRTSSSDLSHWADVLGFFSEVGGCGVIGSYLLDSLDKSNNVFSFKHHYISGALDSEVLCTLLQAIYGKRIVTFDYERRTGERGRCEVIPLKVLVSAQSGRQYLLGYSVKFRCIHTYRLDHIDKAEMGERAPETVDPASILEKVKKHLWGVSLGRGGKPERVEFTLYIGDDEEYIYRRLLREKRCGTAERLDAHSCRFSAEVWDTSEMIPWIRTFICRITQLDFSDRTIENQLRGDIAAMYALYGIEGE